MPEKIDGNYTLCAIPQGSEGACRCWQARRYRRHWRLDVRQDDGYGSWNGWGGCSIFVSAASCDDSDNGQDDGYIIINRSQPKISDDGRSTPQLDWCGTDADCNSGKGTIGNSWWHTLVDQPLLDVHDLSRQSGLFVRREN